MAMGVRHVMLLGCIVSTMMTADAAVIDDEPWKGLEHLDICLDVDSPSAGQTCTLCPAVLTGVSVWRCCHDPRVLEDCADAVDSALEDSDNEVEKRRTKYFLGKKRGVKYFLGKRDSGNYAPLPPFFDRQHLAQELAFRRSQHSGVPEKRVKYFLG